MFDWDQMDDYYFEKAVEEFWDCPEAMNEDWPDDLWD